MLCVLDDDPTESGKREVIIVVTEIFYGCVTSIFGRCSYPEDGGSKLLIVKLKN